MHIDSYSLKDLYSSPQEQRYERILTKFKEVYGQPATFVVRAPGIDFLDEGRVNLIGEHIDYQGYGVLPFAIEKDCVIAAAISPKDTLQVSHLEGIYPPSVLPVDPREQVKHQHPYLQYFHAGYLAGVREARPEEGMSQELIDRINSRKFHGILVLVEGNVPIASGLSSSSSFCVCSALLSLHANGLQPYTNKQDFIERVIKYERMVGTACGGMDQSISVLGMKQACLYIQFKPIRAETVHLPKGYKFVIMNSLEESKKLETVGTHYNKRVCQCKIAVRLLCKRLHLPIELYRKWHILKVLQDHLKLSLAGMSLLVDQFIERKPYSKAELQTLLECSLAETLEDIPSSEIVIACNKEYRIYEAAKHVFEEANRVLKFVEVCNSTLQDQPKAELLGRLMNESQRSCKQLYDCSSELLDEITALAREEGALGSRLTGAGWGGCTVSLVPEQQVEQFIRNMKHRFYGRQRFAAAVRQLGIDNIIFETLPAHGASLVKI